MILHIIPNQNEINYPVGHYLKDALQFVKRSVKIIVEKKLFPTSDITIWCRGSSGSMLASMLTIELYNNNYNNIKVSHIKKLGEDSHSSGKVIFCKETFNIIIDDFVASGATIQSIMYEMNYYVEYCDCLIVSGCGTTIDDNGIITLKHKTPKMLITSNNGIRGKLKILKNLTPEKL